MKNWFSEPWTSLASCQSLSLIYQFFMLPQKFPQISCEFCEISKNTFSDRTPLVAAFSSRCSISLTFVSISSIGLAFFHLKEIGSRITASYFVKTFIYVIWKKVFWKIVFCLCTHEQCSMWDYITMLLDNKLFNALPWFWNITIIAIST